MAPESLAHIDLDLLGMNVIGESFIFMAPYTPMGLVEILRTAYNSTFTRYVSGQEGIVVFSKIHKCKYSP